MPYLNIVDVKQGEALKTSQVQQVHHYDMTSPTEKKILSFMELPTGWHFGGGIPPSEETAKAALSLHYQVQLLNYKDDAFPGIDGEIQVCSYREDETLVFTIENDNKIMLTIEKGDEEISKKEDLNLKVAVFSLLDYAKEKCDISESFITHNMTLEEVTSPTWLLKSHATGVAYL